jgi:sialic acid synthase SpsE
MFDIESIFSRTLEKVFVVAEIGINHNGSFDKLIKLIEMAKKSGADAVKFQIFSEEGFYIDRKYIPSQYLSVYPDELFKKLYLPFKAYEEAFKFAESIDILPFATPLDLESLNFLIRMNVKLFKVASSDINYVPLIAEIKKTKKPVILSTGFSRITEIDNCKRFFGNYPLILMYCVSKYPSKPEDFSLNEFKKFLKKYKYVGFSDHTKTLSLPVAFVALGARVIEKHITLDENDDSPDNPVSITPEKFTQMVNMIREVETSLKTPKKSFPDKLVQILSKRSFVARRDIKKGTIISEEYIEAKRPATFRKSNFRNYNEIIDKVAKKDISKGEPL